MIVSFTVPNNLRPYVESLFTHYILNNGGQDFQAVVTFRPMTTTYELYLKQPQYGIVEELASYDFVSNMRAR
jgi:hypothetical protein